MSAHALTTVEFHGASLIAIKGTSPADTLVAMKPVVEGMSLSWEPQLAKIKAHPVLKGCMTLIVMQMPGDTQRREWAFMPLSRLNFWLATIQPGRVPNLETRAKVIEYQNECADVLFAHFFGKATGEAEPLTAKVVGGVVNGIIGKLVRDYVDPWVKKTEGRIERIEAAAIDLAVAHDQRRAVKDKVSALELAVEWEAEQRGRRHLVKRISDALTLVLSGMGMEPELCVLTGTKLFPRDIGRNFMKERGNAMVIDHNTWALGDQLLPLKLKSQGRKRYKRGPEDEN